MRFEAHEPESDPSPEAKGRRLDINSPKKMIFTRQGGLTRDPIYQGIMYLLGLLLPSGGIRRMSYAYSYNFIDGTTTRDRDTLAGYGEDI
jgi:hypothetical protein